MTLWKFLRLTTFLRQFPPKLRKTKTLSSPPICLKVRASQMLLVGQSNPTKYLMEFNERKPLELANLLHIGRLRLQGKRSTQCTTKGWQMSTRSSKPILTRSILITRFIIIKSADIKESWTFSS